MCSLKYMYVKKKKKNTPKPAKFKCESNATSFTSIQLLCSA